MTRKKEKKTAIVALDVSTKTKMLSNPTPKITNGRT